MGKSITLVFDRHNDTKNKVRFKERCPDGKKEAVKWLYVDTEIHRDQLDEADVIEATLKAKED